MLEVGQKHDHFFFFFNRSWCFCFVCLVHTIFSFSAQCQRSVNEHVLRDARSKWTLQYSTVLRYIVHLSGIHQFIALFTALLHGFWARNECHSFVSHWGMTTVYDVLTGAELELSVAWQPWILCIIFSQQTDAGDPICSSRTFLFIRLSITLI